MIKSHGRSALYSKNLTMLAGDAEIRLDEGHGCDASQEHKNLWVYQGDLSSEPAHTGRLLIRQRVAVSGRTAFHNVCDIYPCPVQINNLQHGIQKLSRRADKGFALQILLLAGAFPDEHNVCVLVSYSKDQIVPCAAQSAALTGGTFLFQSFPAIHRAVSSGVMIWLQVSI